MNYLFKVGPNQCFLLVLLLTTINSFAQIKNLELSNKQSILNGRIYLVFPEKAKNVMRTVDIMEANPSENAETRIVMDIDSMRIVFFARELFQKSDRQFLEAIRQMDKADFMVERLKQTDSLDVLLEKPLLYDSSENAIPIRRLLIKAADNTIFDITAYINPNAFQFKNDFQELTDNIFQTITEGKRRLELQKRTEAVTAYDEKKKFIFSLPENYFISKTVSHDFDVIRIKRVRDITDTSWSGITIYSGGYPSYFYPDYEFNVKEAQQVKGHFLNHPLEWLSFKRDTPSTLLKEVQLPGDIIQKNLILHIALLASDPEEMERLTKLVEAVTLSN